jgi:CxxC motif-containing protein
MINEYTCITCPRGCDIEAVIEEGAVRSVEGAGCPKGLAFVEQELTDPQRNIATSVLVLGGSGPLASVRLSKPIPKSRIADALSEIKALRPKAPVRIGQTLIRDLLGLGCDVLVTRAVPAAQPSGRAEKGVETCL